MQVDQKVLEEINSKPFSLSSRNAIVGLDGFVDKIVAPVEKRHGLGDQFEAVPTIAEMGAKISAAAGKSANIELYPRFEKLGGNGPIMANAMLSLGMDVRYVGALGKPNLHPVFEEFASKTKAVSICEPGITTAMEFKDGKVMLGNTLSLEEIDYSRVIDACGEGEFIDLLSRADLVSIVNWTMIPKMTAFLVELLEKLLPNLPPRDTRHFFFDLADPAKRSSSDISEVLQVISRFQAHSEVTLGLNYNEGLQVCEVLGLKSGSKDEESLRSMATEIRRNLEISTLYFTRLNQPHAQPRMAHGGPPVLIVRILKLPPVRAIISMLGSAVPVSADFLRPHHSHLPPVHPDTMCGQHKVHPLPKLLNYSNNQLIQIYELRKRHSHFL